MSKSTTITLKQLQQELVDCDPSNKTKKMLLTKLIKQKLLIDATDKELKRKSTGVKVQEIPTQSKVPNIPKKEKEPVIVVNTSPIVQEIDPLDELLGLDNEDVQEVNNTESVNDPNDRDYFRSPVDVKYKTEIEKDFANNKLMERMNGELDFRIKNNKKLSRIFEKPYFESGSKFQPFNAMDDISQLDDTNDKVDIPANDFTSSRLLGQRKSIKPNKK